MILAVICGSYAVKGLAYSGDKMPKIYREFEDKVEKMKRKGALAVIGIAVSDAGRIDLGKRKAIDQAKIEMSEQRKTYVEGSTHNFFDEIGLGKGVEHNDVFKQVIESVTVTMLSGVAVGDFTYFITKDNKKEGTATYLVLYVITPEAMQKALETELKAKGSKENLYQRYIDSQAKQEHDKMIEKYKAEFEEK